MAANNGEICFVQNNKVRCFDGSGEDSSVSELTNVREVAGAGQTMCALSDAGFQCWGDVYLVGSKARTAPGAHNLMVTKGRGCYLDGGTLRCLGDNYHSVSTSGPALAGVQNRFMMNDAQCGTRGNQLVCSDTWASGALTEISYSLPDIHEIYGNDDGICIVDATTVQCSGNDIHNIAFTTKFTGSGLHNFVKPTATIGCVWTDESYDGFQCFGAESDADQIAELKRDVPEPKNMRQAIGGGGASCILDDEGASCWGNIGGLPRTAHREQKVWNVQGLCAFSNLEVVCWGYKNKHTDTIYDRWAPLVNPIKDGHTPLGCFLDDTGLNCWDIVSGEAYHDDLSGWPKPKWIATVGDYGSTTQYSTICGVRASGQIACDRRDTPGSEYALPLDSKAEYVVGFGNTLCGKYGSQLICTTIVHGTPTPAAPVPGLGPIKEIRDNVVIRADNSLVTLGTDENSGVLTVRPINYGMMNGQKLTGAHALQECGNHDYVCGWADQGAFRITKDYSEAYNPFPIMPGMTSMSFPAGLGYSGPDCYVQNGKTDCGPREL